MPIAGDTFLFAGESTEKLHLNVLVNDPTPSGEIVLVTITTLRKRTVDRTVILHIGDHPFIKHDSAVAYGFAQIVQAKSIEEALKNGDAIAREKMPESVLKRIRIGLLESEFTENGVRHFFRELQLV